MSFEHTAVNLPLSAWREELGASCNWKLSGRVL